MKPNPKTIPHSAFARTLLAAVAMLALGAGHTVAGDALPATVVMKLDPQIVLALKQSRGESISAQPDIPIKDGAGRVLIDVQATVSPALLNQVTLNGGQVISGSTTATTFRAMFPLAQVEALASRADVRSVAAAHPTFTSRVTASPNH
jgi:hypothetical protein